MLLDAASIDARFLLSPSNEEALVGWRGLDGVELSGVLEVSGVPLSRLAEGCSHTGACSSNSLRTRRVSAGLIPSGEELVGRRCAARMAASRSSWSAAAETCGDDSAPFIELIWSDKYDDWESLSVAAVRVDQVDEYLCRGPGSSSHNSSNECCTLSSCDIGVLVSSMMVSLSG
jgi:hypothetical protein